MNDKTEHISLFYKYTIGSVQPVLVQNNTWFNEMLVYDSMSQRITVGHLVWPADKLNSLIYSNKAHELAYVGVSRALSRCETRPASLRLNCLTALRRAAK